MADKALEAALPGEAEVVAWRHKLTVGLNSDTEISASSEHPFGKPGRDFDQSASVKSEPLVTLASRQAMQARAENAERERNEANAGWEHTSFMLGAALSRAEAAEARVKELEEERDALRSRIEEQRVNFAGLQAVQDALNLILPPAKGGSNG